MNDKVAVDIIENFRSTEDKANVGQGVLGRADDWKMALMIFILSAGRCDGSWTTEDMEFLQGTHVSGSFMEMESEEKSEVRLDVIGVFHRGEFAIRFAGRRQSDYVNRLRVLVCEQNNVIG